MYIYIYICIFLSIYIYICIYIYIPYCLLPVASRPLPFAWIEATLVRPLQVAKLYVQTPSHPCKWPIPRNPIAIQLKLATIRQTRYTNTYLSILLAVLVIGRPKPRLLLLRLAASAFCDCCCYYWGNEYLCCGINDIFINIWL